jgi:hypothetical protein
MQEIYSEWNDKSVIGMLEIQDVEELLHCEKYDIDMQDYIKNDLALQFMKTYGTKIGQEYFIEKEKFLELVRKGGELLLLKE